MRYAIIQSGIVINVIEADPEHLPSLPGMQLLASETAGVGWAYADGAFTPPVTQPPAALDTRITRLAFRNRFTTAEKVALELAALDNPSTPMAQRQQSAELRAHLKDLDAASWVDLTRPETGAALQMLEASGLIGEGRAAAILDVDSITDIERPQ